LQAVVEAGQAENFEDAVVVLARQRVERHRDRLDAARTPLAKARALERILNELGLAARARLRSEAIHVEWTSTAVIREALGGRETLDQDWLKKVLDTVLKETGMQEAPKVVADTFLATSNQPESQPVRAP
jgi:hypothetical protein